MKKQNLIYLVAIIILPFTSCKTQKNKVQKYVPVDMVLFNQITAMDKEFFDAYNSCDLNKQDTIYSENIEFFHDKGGLSTSKKDILEGTKKNICGKVTRHLIAGSIEVYPINNYGAVEMGFHKFFNNQEPNAESKPSKFIILWKLEKGNWKITKVVSLH